MVFRQYKNWDNLSSENDGYIGCLHRPKDIRWDQSRGQHHKEGRVHNQEKTGIGWIASSILLLSSFGLIAVEEHHCSNCWSLQGQKESFSPSTEIKFSFIKCLSIATAGLPEGEFIYVAVSTVSCDGKELQKYADHTEPLCTFTSINLSYLRNFHWNTHNQKLKNACQLKKIY